MTFEGILPPLATPFHDDGTVDEAGYSRLVDHLVESGVHGVIAGGTTGEYYALGRAERVRQFACAKEAVAGRVPLICGVNDLTTDAACELAAAARAAGADALLVAAPPYALPSQDELAAHCLAVARAGDLPVMLYNYPGRTGVEMGEAFLDQVVDEQYFAAIKEASGSLDRVHLLASRYPGLQLSCGAEDQALEFFLWGATSWVTPMANFLPRETIALYEACVRDGDFARGRKIMSALLPLTETLERSGALVQCTKLALAEQGLPAGPVRRPLAPIHEDLANTVRQALRTAKQTLGALAQDRSGEPASSAAE